MSIQSVRDFVESRRSTNVTYRQGESAVVATMGGSLALGMLDAMTGRPGAVLRAVRTDDGINVTVSSPRSPGLPGATCSLRCPVNNDVETRALLTALRDGPVESAAVDAPSPVTVERYVPATARPHVCPPCSVCTGRKATRKAWRARTGRSNGG